MSARSLILLPALALLLAGCGGGGEGDGIGIGDSPGDVSGVVFDIEGNPVRDARVFIEETPERETRSNVTGTYVLRDVPSEDVVVYAEVTQDGRRYIGQNLARVFENDRSKNVNIVLVREDRTATIRGTVRTTDGGFVEGARVFALAENGLSSSVSITDFNGNFVIRRLASDVDYEVFASAPEFRGDVTIVNLDPAEDRTVNLAVSESLGGFNLNPPTGLSAVAWTSPEEATRSAESASTYEAIKRLFDPARAQRASAVTRQTLAGTLIEIDLTWNRVLSDYLLGYGIYRARQGGALQSEDFLRDPLASFYADADDELDTLTTYIYAVTSVNTDRSEGPFSQQVSVETLGELEADDVDDNPLRFRWFAAQGAEEYVVFLFDRYPRLGVSSLWNNAANPTTATSLEYTGPGLIPGRTYYYVVLGLANDQTSRTISEVRSFVKN